WSGNPKYAEDRNRSIPLPSFHSLLQIEGIQFFSLQIGPAASQLAEIVAPLADLVPGSGRWPTQRPGLPDWIWSSLWIPRSRTLLGHWECRFGCCSPLCPTGDGS